MLALKTIRAAGLPVGFEPFLMAMADALGEITNLLVFADWLDERDRPALAEAVRAKAERLGKRYRRAAACIDAMLAVNSTSVVPVLMPPPDRGQHRSRQQWCGLVRAALRPFKLHGVSVAAAPGWRGGPDIEVKVPGADLSVSDASGAGFVVPWGLTSAAMLAAGVLCFAELLPRLFPDEPARIVHDDGGSFEVPFWRCVIRLQP